MTLISFNFFVFLLATVVVYYFGGRLFGGKVQKYILLIASLFFYFSASYRYNIDDGNTHYSAVSTVILVVSFAVITYIGGLLIGKFKGRLRTLFKVLSIVLLLLMYYFSKYAYNTALEINNLLSVSRNFSWFNFFTVIGISYFMLNAIGYLIDVSWDSYEPEKNIFTLSLFIFYFPQMISGPITRFAQMKPQFCERHALSYDNVTHGIRRMILGYVKRVVISETFAIIGGGYSSFSNVKGIEIIAITFCHLIRLYADFSGCMDIVLGASEIFGIKLPENFHAPFFSKTHKEFWNRWHISLGSWLKDYVMYPFQKSSPMTKFSKHCRKNFGKKVGKKIPVYLAMALVWFLIGAWHGGGIYFFTTGLMPYLFLVFGDIMTPFYKKMAVRLKINTECRSWRIFQSARTVFVLGSIMIFMLVGNIPDGFKNLGLIFTDFISYRSFDVFFDTVGFSAANIIVAAASIVLLYVMGKIDYYEKTDIFKVMDGQNAVVRCLAIYAELAAIAFFGIVGDASFIYFRF